MAVKVNVVTCDYIDFYLTVQYLLLHYSQCNHMCQVKVNVVTCEYIDFYLTAQYLLLYYGQCTHMCQTKVNVLTCEYIESRIVPSPSIYMANCSTVSLLQQFSTMINPFSANYQNTEDPPLALIPIVWNFKRFSLPPLKNIWKHQHWLLVTYG